MYNLILLQHTALLCKLPKHLFHRALVLQNLNHLVISLFQIEPQQSSSLLSDIIYPVIHGEKVKELEPKVFIRLVFQTETPLNLEIYAHLLLIFIRRVINKAIPKITQTKGSMMLRSIRRRDNTGQKILNFDPKSPLIHSVKLNMRREDTHNQHSLIHNTQKLLLKLWIADNRANKFLKGLIIVHFLQSFKLSLGT